MPVFRCEKMQKLERMYKEKGKNYRETLEHKIAHNAEASVFVRPKEGYEVDSTAMYLQGITPKSLVSPSGNAP